MNARCWRSARVPIRMWPSFIGAERIRERLVAHGRAELAEVRVYPGAGT
jgi:hypothetical protein